MTGNKVNKSIVIDLLKGWLVGANFTGFEYTSSFTLFFCTEVNRSYQGVTLPDQLNLSSENCWLGPIEKRDEDIASLSDSVNACDVLLAQRLTRHFWDGNVTVKDIVGRENAIVIVFEDDVELTATFSETYEYPFLLESNFANHERYKAVDFVLSWVFRDEFYLKLPMHKSE